MDFICFFEKNRCDDDFSLASGDANHIAFKSGDLNERYHLLKKNRRDDDFSLASFAFAKRPRQPKGDAKHIAFKSGDLNERCHLF